MGINPIFVLQAKFKVSSQCVGRNDGGVDCVGGDWHCVVVDGFAGCAGGLGDFHEFFFGWFGDADVFEGDWKSYADQEAEKLVDFFGGSIF